MIIDGLPSEPGHEPSISLVGYAVSMERSGFGPGRA